MAYVQRFGVSRTSPVAISNNPATDIIDKQNIKASEEKSPSFLDYLQDGLVVLVHFLL